MAQITKAKKKVTDLLLLTAHEVDAQRESVSAFVLFAYIKDLDLGFGDTTEISGLDVRFVLTVALAASRATSHFD